jgi:ABC-2 type transport system ATP-binding protein
VSFVWERGLLVILGTPVDGTSLLLDVVAGAHRPSRGTVEVLGRSPEEVRGGIALVPREPRLPDAVTVAEVVELAALLRGQPVASPASRLAPLGLESLAKRKTSSLSPSETRAVSLSLAITSNAPVLLVDEPLSGLEPMAPARVVEALRARAANGACVVVSTASVRDGTRLADQLALMTRGTLAPLLPAYAHAGNDGARLRIVVAPRHAASVPVLVSALREESGVSSVETATFAASLEGEAGAGILVSGQELLAVASSVSRAIARTGLDVEVVESAVMPLDGIRATLTSPRRASVPVPTDVATTASRASPETPGTPLPAAEREAAVVATTSDAQAMSVPSEAAGESPRVEETQKTETDEATPSTPSGGSS